MKEILQNLKELETKHKIKILYACESGSRAWGFPSPNSDYDVRFTYVHEFDWYLSLQDKNNTIELPISNDLDIGGWEIKKALGLLWKSNPPLLEWLQSPIAYQAETQFLKDIQTLSHQYFSPIAVMHHYLSMSKKYREACQKGNLIKLKKYFYALRTAIAGKWIRMKNTTPPIELVKMFEVVPDEIQMRIQELILIKANQKEDYLHNREFLIDEFLAITIKENELTANDLPSAKRDVEKLDQFYREIVKGKYS